MHDDAMDVDERPHDAAWSPAATGSPSEPAIAQRIHSRTRPSPTKSKSASSTTDPAFKRSRPRDRRESSPTKPQFSHSTNHHWRSSSIASPSNSSGLWSFDQPDPESSWYAPRSASPTKASFSRPASPTKLSLSESRPASPTKLKTTSSSASSDDGATAVATSRPSSPTKARPRPPSLRLHSNPAELDPAVIVGKTLRKVVRGSIHPSLTLVFDDSSAVQVRVDGYNPNAPGLSKALDVPDALQPVDGRQDVDLVITDCALVRLTDKAFERRMSNDAAGSKDARWDQDHLGVAFKFSGMTSWHCVSATMSDFDETRACTFLSYDDVYLSPVAHSSPQRRAHVRKKSMPWT